MPESPRTWQQGGEQKWTENQPHNPQHTGLVTDRHEGDREPGHILHHSLEPWPYVGIANTPAPPLHPSHQDLLVVLQSWDMGE